MTEQALAVGRAAPLEFSAEQRKMIRDTFANGASADEFAVLMEVAKARRLNPLLKQIYFVKRYDSAKRCEVWSTQISIDGLRVVAERTGVYDGQDEPEYVHDETTGDLTECKVKVYRKDWPRPAVGVAYFSEYAQVKRDGGLTQFWATKPHIMLAKCAEALAIRKAFPEDTGGLYVAEEMAQEREDDTAAMGAVDVTPKKAPEAPQAPARAPEGVTPSPEQRHAARALTEAAAAAGPSGVPAPVDLKMLGKRLAQGRTNEQQLEYMHEKLGRSVSNIFKLSPEERETLAIALEEDETPIT